MTGPTARRLGALAAFLALLAPPSAARAASDGPEYGFRIGSGPTSNAQALDDAGGSSSGSGGGSCVAWAPGSGGSNSSSGSGSGSGSGVSSSSSSGGSNSSGSSSGGALDDVQPPSEPGSVVVSALTSSSAKVTWTASTDDVAVISYRIRAQPAGSQAPFTEWVDGCTHEATVTGLAPQTAYSFTVEAEDIGGHRTRSAPAPATTADPPPFMLSVVPQTLMVTCGTPASVTVQITPASGFTGAVELAAEAWGDLQVAFTPSATANAMTATFSCKPFPGGGGGPFEITGRSGALVASTRLQLFVYGNQDPGGDPGSSSGAGGSSGGSSGAGGDTGSSSGGGSGGYVSSSSSSSGGGSSGGSGVWSGSSGGSSGGSGSGAIGGSGSGGGSSSGGRSETISSAGVPQTGCASSGGAEAGLLSLTLLLSVARSPRRRGMARPAA